MNITTKRNRILYQGTILLVFILLMTVAQGFSAFSIQTAPTKAKGTSTKVNINHFPILMYHTSSENHPGKLAGLFIKPSEFEKQLIFLKKNGYTPITFEDFPLKDVKKPVMLTFDDGYQANYTDIFPLLKKYNVKATIFVVTNPINRPKRLTAVEIREMSLSGLVSIQSHTCSHRNLKTLSGKDLDVELGKSRDILERLTGKRVIALAYPNGDYSRTQLMRFSKYYNYGLRKDGGFYNSKESSFEIRRLRVDRSIKIKAFSRLVGSH